MADIGWHLTCDKQITTILQDKQVQPGRSHGTVADDTPFELIPPHGFDLDLGECAPLCGTRVEALGSPGPLTPGAHAVCSSLECNKYFVLQLCQACLGQTHNASPGMEVCPSAQVHHLVLMVGAQRWASPAWGNLLDVQMCADRHAYRLEQICTSRSCTCSAAQLSTPCIGAASCF